MSTVARSSTSTSSTAAITNYSSPSANTILSNPGAAGISSAGRLAAASPEQAYGMSSVRSAINQVGTGSLVSPAGGLLEGNVSPLSVSPARYSANGHGAPLAAQTSATVTTTEHSNANSSMAAAPARTSSSAAPAAAQPRNPLIDLIETERAYVDDLAMVIKVRCEDRMSCTYVMFAAEKCHQSFDDDRKWQQHGHVQTFRLQHSTSSFER